MGASGEKAGGGARAGPSPHGGGRRDWGSSCFLIHSLPHFPLCSVPTSPTSSWLLQPSVRGPFPSGRARGISSPSLPLLRSGRKPQTASGGGGEGRPCCSQGLHVGCGLARRASRAHFAAPVPSLPALRFCLPVSEKLKSCASANPRPR